MIISRTPFRISFFGGGTDYSAWYREHPGAVLSTTINKYCYISCRYLPPFFEHKSRVVWSIIESVKDRSEIQHPAVRAGLEFLDIQDGIELHYDGDLPARTGLGSSSAFTVGLLHALYGLKGMRISKQQLGQDAIYIEQEMLKEHVGCQDQVITAYGGLNRIDFSGEGTISVSPIPLSVQRKEELEQHLMLFFTGISRTASEIAKTQIESMKYRDRELTAMYEQVEQAIQILQGSGDLVPFGQLLDDAWQLKRILSEKISTPQIDAMYEAARSAGAIGGKLLGAGGGGFLLLFVKPDDQAAVKEALGDYLHVPFRFEYAGSRIVFYEPEESSKVLSPTVVKAVD